MKHISIYRRLTEAERRAKMKPKKEPENVLIYDPNVAGAADRAVDEFRRQYPDYGDLVIVLPDNGRPDEAPPAGIRRRGLFHRNL